MKRTDLRVGGQYGYVDYPGGTPEKVTVLALDAKRDIYSGWGPVRAVLNGIRIRVEASDGYRRVDREYTLPNAAKLMPLAEYTERLIRLDAERTAREQKRDRAKALTARCAALGVTLEVTESSPLDAFERLITLAEAQAFTMEAR